MDQLQVEYDGARADGACADPTGATVQTLTAVRGGRRERRHASALFQRVGRLAALVRVRAHAHAGPAIATALMQGLVM